jgi:hypothetical protein
MNQDQYRSLRDPEEVRDPHCLAGRRKEPGFTSTGLWRVRRILPTERDII